LTQANRDPAAHKLQRTQDVAASSRDEREWAEFVVGELPQDSSQRGKRRPAARASKAGIPVFKTIPYSGRVAKGGAIAPRHTVFRNRTQALLHVAVLLEALEEVEEFDPLRLGNRPRPALWLDQPLYREDVKSLVAELRALQQILQGDKSPKGSAAKKAIGVAAAATVKVIDGYAETLGKDAAALTIGAVGALPFHLGIEKTVLAELWERLRIGR
jgi:hypothetical protein